MDTVSFNFSFFLISWKFTCNFNEIKLILTFWAAEEVCTKKLASYAIKMAFYKHAKHNEGLIRQDAAVKSNRKQQQFRVVVWQSVCVCNSQSTLAAYIHSYITTAAQHTYKSYVWSMCVHTRALNKNTINAYCLAHRFRAHTFCENKCSPSHSHSAPALWSRRVHSAVSWCSREQCMANMPPNLKTTKHTHPCMHSVNTYEYVYMYLHNTARSSTFDSLVLSVWPLCDGLHALSLLIHHSAYKYVCSV